MYKKRRRAMQKHRAKEKKYELRRKLEREQAETATRPTSSVRAPQPARSRGGARAES